MIKLINSVIQSVCLFRMHPQRREQNQEELLLDSSRFDYRRFLRIRNILINLFAISYDLLSQNARNQVYYEQMQLSFRSNSMSFNKKSYLFIKH